MPSAFGGQSQQRWGDNTLNQNEYLRDFLLTDLSGKPCKTADARKKGMLAVVFFRTDDVLSQQVLPFFQKLADAYKESGKLTVWGISQDGETETRALALQQGITFPLLLDRDRYLSMTYGVTTVPTAYLAAGDGRIVRKMGGLRGTALNEMSAKVALFAEVEPVVLDESAAMPAPPPPALPPAEPSTAAA
ncbi:MAG: TlpA family protein disulfide reductase [Cytophagales bacterium]|nr:TlpA family protein disulfide reductase [Armatimonadota bacterium]